VWNLKVVSNLPQPRQRLRAAIPIPLMQIQPARFAGTKATLNPHLIDFAIGPGETPAF
jgi:hypothetical protein